MGAQIEIDDAFYLEAQSQAKVELRSVSNQVEYWARIGKIAIENPDMSIEAIKALLSAKNQPSEPFEFRE